MPEPRFTHEGISHDLRTPEAQPARATEHTFLILTLAACGMAALLALLPAAGHDQMWLLYAARLHLQGAPLYGSQIFETNPPLIIWLSMVPEALARLTHLPDTALGKLFLLAVEFGIAAVCLNLLRRIRPDLTRATRLALAFAFITTFAVMPARDFGQRDHLLILFLLPYIFAAAVRAQALTPVPSKPLPPSRSPPRSPGSSGRHRHPGPGRPRPETPPNPHPHSRRTNPPPPHPRPGAPSWLR